MLFLPLPFFTRYFSTVEDPLLQQLSTILDDILYSYESDLYNIDQILNREILLSGRYVLSPLEVIFIKKSEIFQFSENYYDYYNPFFDIPDLMNTSDPDIKIAVLPTKEDTFLLLGLSQLLLRLSGRWQRKGKMINEFSFMEKELYVNLLIKEPVDRLYKLDLKDSFRIISNSLILDKVKPLVGEGSAVYDLISSFLHLHIIDDGHHKADICKLSKLILPLGDITMVLFHIVLMDLDREFKKRFSSIRYYRLLDEVYILTNDVIFDDKAGYALLEELGLAGQIESIGPGDDPLLCRRSWCSYTNSVYLDYDKYVRVFSK